jgi:hypothetical protein
MDDLDFGSTVGEKETDYSPKLIPKPFFTYADNEIQYNQKLVDAYSCSIHAVAGVISDLTGKSYSTDELKKLWEKALILGATPGLGWSLSGAVDLLRKEWNKTNEKKLLYFRVDRNSQKFWEGARMGYSFAVAYRGNGTYNKDKNDGQLDGTNFGLTNYGHLIRVALVGDYLVVTGKDLTAIDNYKGITHNTYLIPVDHWDQLANFFPSAYFFTGEDEYRKLNDAYQQLPSWAEESWEKLKHIFDEPTPGKPLNIDQVQWTLHKLGYIEKPTEELTQARWTVILNRLIK